MATVTLAIAPTWTTAAGAKTSTATPALGDAIIVVAAASGITTNLGVTDNNSGGHGTYLLVNGAASLAGSVVINTFVRADPIRSATSTVWTTSGDGSSTGGGIAVYRVSGLTLTALQAIRQFAGQSNGAAAGTPTGTLGPLGAALTGNALIGGVVNGSNTATLTPPTSWTEDADLGYNAPATGLEIVHINSGFTGSTVTWGSTSASTYAMVVLELNGAQGNLAVTLPPERRLEQAVNRAAVFCLGDKWARRKGLWVPSREIALPV